VTLIINLPKSWLANSTEASVFSHVAYKELRNQRGSSQASRIIFYSASPDFGRNPNSILKSFSKKQLREFVETEHVDKIPDP
jgi:hypothetical protein